MPTIDLNADLGEGFGAWRMGDDAAMLQVVSSANIACGFHAGDPDIMADCFARAEQAGVAVGAHVSFPDLAGFGRRVISMSAPQIERCIAYQLGAAQGVAAYAGHRIAFVKAHGALANLAERDREVAEAIARAVAAVDPSLILLAIALSEQVAAGERANLRVAHEIFADRAYTRDGRLAPRAQKGAVLHETDKVVERSVRMLAEGGVITRGERLLPTPIDSICVHGDTPRAVEMAQGLRAALEASGWSIRAFSPPP